MSIIKTIGLTKKFGDFVANDHIDLSVDDQEIRCIVGENGAGKSTLMNMLYGLLRPTSGQILINDSPVTFASPVDAIAHGLGMVHQHFKLVPSLTVYENVLLGAELKKAGTPFIDSATETRGGLQAHREVQVRPEPHRQGRGPVRRRPAARGDPEDALPQRRHPHPRRAHGRADPAGGRRPHRHPAGAARPGQDHHHDHAQAARGHGALRLRHRHSPRQGDGQRPHQGHERVRARADDGRARGPHGDQRARRARSHRPGRP